MGLPRPKILTAVTVPTGGWTFAFSLSTSVGGYEQATTATLAAGTYYMSWDGQSDDLLHALGTVIQAAIVAVGAPFNADAKVLIDITTGNKVRFTFDGTTFAVNNNQDVKLRWTSTTAGLANVLGFDTSADDTSSGDNQQFTADYQHSHGWYANEDGQLGSIVVEDVNRVERAQAVALSGKVFTQKTSQKFANVLQLRWLSRARTFSRAVNYGATSVDPYARNVPLECWWEEIQNGTQFRVYANGLDDTTRADLKGVATASNTTTLTNSSITMTTEPQQYKSCLLYIDDYSASRTIPARFFISSHTATVFTIPAAHYAGYNLNAYATNYYVFKHRYQTYVADLGSMQDFAPIEIPELDRYNIDIPLLRYV